MNLVYIVRLYRGYIIEKDGQLVVLYQQHTLVCTEERLLSNSKTKHQHRSGIEKSPQLFNDTSGLI